MPGLDENFKELKFQLKQRQHLNHTGTDPVYYLIFRPEDMLEIKRRLRFWTAQLKAEGWQVHFFSMIDAVHNILRNHNLRPVWLEAEKDDPFNFEEINKTLSEALIGTDALKQAILTKLESLRGQKNALLLITDLEAIHPYLRISSLEQKLQGRFYVPTIILYPGIRTGKTTLKFLGIYPENGSYRSIHIGG